METKYSRNKFDGFTHRFIVQFDTVDPYYNNIHIYSNSNSHLELNKFIEEKKSNKVLSYKIIHCASKEQDEMSSKFIEETLKDI